MWKEENESLKEKGTVEAEKTESLARAYFPGKCSLAFIKHSFSVRCFVHMKSQHGNTQNEETMRY